MKKTQDKNKLTKKNSKSNTDRKVIVNTQSLFKIYHKGQPNEVKALNDVDIKIYQGEMVAIMGESGSGKTTLLNCISGIDNPSSGKIEINGQDIAKLRDRKKTKFRATNMGFIFQTFNLIPVLSALENVELPLILDGVKRSVAKKKAKELLEQVGLGDRLYHKPNELSGGQRQRVTVARSLANDPTVIWADEPTGNLDSDTAKEVMDLIKKMNKEKGTTVVMVTHSHSISKYAQRTIHMDSGKVVKK